MLKVNKLAHWPLFAEQWLNVNTSLATFEQVAYTPLLGLAISYPFSKWL
jgi:hypothetical protein